MNIEEYLRQLQRFSNDFAYFLLRADALEVTASNNYEAMITQPSNSATSYGLDITQGAWDAVPAQREVEDPKVKLELQRKERLTKALGKKRSRWA